MYIFDYEVSLVWVLILVNVGMTLALVLVLLELRQLRKLRQSFERMFGKHEEILEKDEEIFWKELEKLKKLKS
ncbi:MAG: hypothetical protein B6U72_06925 [Candidatus Altiarchaeales archaeon ex4484_2]|nr:MAG: hypothetical protein B6U72_06925 [Candidatus Altiarchaeales archaeon ex4484_2]